jgi:hypothetical protein
LNGLEGTTDTAVFFCCDSFLQDIANSRRRPSSLPYGADTPGSLAFEKLAQNGRGIKRATQRAAEFLCWLVARTRALCALTKLVTFSGPASSHFYGPAATAEVLLVR